MSDCNPLLWNVELQKAADRRLDEVMTGHTDEEQDIHTRCVLMSDLIRNMRAKRIDKTEKDRIALDAEILDKMRDFKEVHWAALQEKHRGILTDDQNPFPRDITPEEVLGSEIDRMLDCLSTLLDQEQNSLSHITRKLKYHTDQANLISTVTADFARQNPLKTMVRNQTVGIH